MATEPQSNILHRRGSEWPGSPVARQLSGGDDGGMDGIEQRLRAVEVGVAKLDERASSIQQNMATKADLVEVYKSINGLTWKLVGAVAAIVAVATAIAKFIH